MEGFGEVSVSLAALETETHLLIGELPRQPRFGVGIKVPKEIDSAAQRAIDGHPVKCLRVDRKWNYHNQSDRLVSKLTRNVGLSSGRLSRRS